MAEADEFDTQADRETLVTLYFATVGPEWKRIDNWPSAAPLDQWFGVDTDDDGSATTLGLAGNGLSGQIPRELANLSRLRSLFLPHNNLTGEIPIELTTLSDLSLLRLWRNRLVGEIPREVGNLVHLQGLNLSYNRICGEIPATLGAFRACENSPSRQAA